MPIQREREREKHCKKIAKEEESYLGRLVDKLNRKRQEAKKFKEIGQDKVNRQRDRERKKLLKIMFRIRSRSRVSVDRCKIAKCSQCQIPEWAKRQK